MAVGQSVPSRTSQIEGNTSSHVPGVMDLEWVPHWRRRVATQYSVLRSRSPNEGALFPPTPCPALPLAGYSSALSIVVQHLVGTFLAHASSHPASSSSTRGDVRRLQVRPLCHLCKSLTCSADVEHASAPLPGSARGPLPPLQYEGFEPSPYDQGDARADIFQVRAGNIRHHVPC